MKPFYSSIVPTVVLLLVPLAHFGCGGGGSSSRGPDAPSSAADSEKNAGNDNSWRSSSSAESDASDSEWTESPTPEEERRNKTFPSKRSMDDIIAIINDNRHLFRLCYEKYQHENPELQGDVVISFRITSRGKVIDAQVNPEGTTLTDENVGSCAANEMKKLTFPEVSSGMDTEVNYPFNFKPRSR